MTTVIKVGMWKYAPFAGAISSSIDILNNFIKSKGWDAYYEIVSLDPRRSELPKIDIVMLDGGEDINPGLYGERNLYSFFNTRRDDEEMTILRNYQVTMGDSFRVSGSCRGHQMIAAFFGGTLYQDIHKQVLDKHGAKHPSPHKVSTSKPNTYYGTRGCELHKFIKDSDPFYVSSLHHQAVKSLPRNFSTTMLWKHARGLVKLVEGIESKDGRFRGVQSHPEFKSFATDGFLFSYLMHADYFLAAFEASEDIKPSEAEIQNVRLKKDLRISREDSVASIAEEYQEEREERLGREVSRPVPIILREQPVSPAVSEELSWDVEEN